MPNSLLAAKLKLKAGQKAALVGAPAAYLQERSPLPEDIQLSNHLDGKYNWVQVLLNSEAELFAFLPRIISSLQPNSLLWLTFPKGGSKVQTDLTRDQGWDSVRKVDMKWIKLVSVNATWSAFSLRPFRPGEDHQSFR